MLVDTYSPVDPDMAREPCRTAASVPPDTEWNDARAIGLVLR